MSLNFCSSPVFLLLDWNHGFYGENYHKEVPFSSNRIRDTLCAHDTGDVNLDHLVKVVTTRSLHCKPTFYVTLSFGSESVSPAHIPGQGK